MATYGYGKKAFIQGLARIACRIAKYLVKHDAKLKADLPGTAYTCAQGMVACLNQLCELLNKSAS